MATKQCRDCSGVVGASADTCPHCGAKQKKRSVIGGIAAILLIIAIIKVLFTSSEKPPTATPKSSSDRAAESAAAMRADEIKAASRISLSMTWKKADTGNVMKTDVSLFNQNVFPVKDIAIECAVIAKSGTVIGGVSKTIYEKLDAGQTTLFRDINFGFVNDQAESARCAVVRVRDGYGR